MKKTFFLLAALAFVGILGCVAHAEIIPCKDGSDFSQATEATCDLVCQSSHHHYFNPPVIIKAALHQFQSETFTLNRALFYTDPPIRAIFHPPHTF